MIVGRLNKSQDGVIHDLEVEISCLSAGHGNVPKIILNEQIHNAVRSGHDTNPENGGGNSLTKKHCWDMVKVISHNGHKDKEAVVGDIVPTLKAESHGHTPMVQIKSATKDGFETAQEGDSVNFSMPNSKTRRGRVGVAQTLDTQVNQSVIVKAVTETRTDDAKQIRKESMKNGKDFSPRRGKTIKLREDDNANTVTSTQGIEQTIAINGLMEGFRIRRLTEIECERLQGLPDNWTKYGNYDGVVKEISRTQRYKMCGNAVTKDIVEIIGIKLINKLKN